MRLQSGWNEKAPNLAYASSSEESLLRAVPYSGGPGSDHSDPDARGDARSNVFLAAALKASGRTDAVRIRNVSATGALLEGAMLPEKGVSALLERGHVRVDCEIVWKEGKQCGVHFKTPVSVPDWVKRVGHSGQQEVDRKIAALKSAGATIGAQSEFEVSSRHRSLQSVSAELDAICERMASLPDLSIEMAEELLRLDAIAHALRTSAK